MAIDITGINPAQPQPRKAAGPADKGAQSTADRPTSDSVTLYLQTHGLKVDNSGDDIELVDGPRVQSLKSAIDSGIYQINPLRVAEKFIQFEADLKTS